MLFCRCFDALSKEQLASSSMSVDMYFMTKLAHIIHQITGVFKLALATTTNRSFFSFPLCSFFPFFLFSPGCVTRYWTSASMQTIVKRDARFSPIFSVEYSKKMKSIDWWAQRQILDDFSRFIYFLENAKSQTTIDLKRLLISSDCWKRRWNQN